MTSQLNYSSRLFVHLTSLSCIVCCNVWITNCILSNKTILYHTLCGHVWMINQSMLYSSHSIWTVCDTTVKVSNNYFILLIGIGRSWTYTLLQEHRTFVWNIFKIVWIIFCTSTSAVAKLTQLHCNIWIMWHVHHHINAWLRRNITQNGHKTNLSRMLKWKAPIK